MIVYKPKRLVATINGYEIGVESNNPLEDAATFDSFCEAFKSELNKIISKPTETITIKPDVMAGATKS